jgi:hypothetical protein
MGNIYYNAVNRAGANKSRDVRGPLLVEVLAARRRDSPETFDRPPYAFVQFRIICSIVSTNFYIDQYNGLFRQYHGFLMHNHYLTNTSMDWPVFIY